MLGEWRELRKGSRGRGRRYGEDRMEKWEAKREQDSSAIAERPRCRVGEF